MADFGYDLSNQTRVDPIFGTMEDFDILLKTAHSKGNSKNATLHERVTVGPHLCNILVFFLVQLTPFLAINAGLKQRYHEERKY